jgi:hypothetical protein
MKWIHKIGPRVTKRIFDLLKDRMNKEQQQAGPQVSILKT